MSTETLAPLSALASLKALALIVVRLEERSVTPLLALTMLRELVLDLSAFPMEEYARLAARLPAAAELAPWQPLVRRHSRGAHRGGLPRGAGHCTVPVGARRGSPRRTV